MYCDQNDLIKRFGEHELIQLTDRDNQGFIDVDVALSAIDDAAATINGYIAGRYTLPLQTQPAVLNRLACDLARYFLYDESPTELVQKRYDEAIAYLRDVASGKVSLGVNESGDVATSNELAVMESAGSVFARQSAKDFI